MIYILFILFTLAILLFVLYQIQFFLVFEPKKHRREVLDERFTPLEIKTDDGIFLEGIEYAPKEFSRTLIYLGGKSQDSVALIHKLAHHFENFRIVTFNYRGYGESGGTVSEEKLYADALEVAQKFALRYGSFSIVGYSLGSSLAAYIASKVTIEKLVLIGAFDSVKTLFKQRGFPSFLIKYHFDTYLHVREVNAPVYLLASKDDTIVPLQNVYNLKENIKNLAEYKELSSYNHDEILLCEESIEFIKRVLV